jgi:tRNA (guanine-N(7)-)-methyltransferase subunit TRM82
MEIGREHPFQKLCYIEKTTGLLFAAAGPYIYSLSSASGDILSTWPPNFNDGLSDGEDGIATQKHHIGEPPSKKRKLSIPGEAAESSDSSTSVEIVAERAKGQRRKAKAIDSKLPNVSHLIAAKDQKHIIAVTSEDKCIRVFELGNVLEAGKTGRLKLLSERCMPKRLCAIVLTPDDSTILAADKFGDVYSLPLLDVPSASTSATNVQQKPARDFKPSATELTVHTKGNREALRQQREQKAAAKTREGPNFEHKLLLGHVSLLTDLIIAETDTAGKRRQYILTADRDEHIRVSRGPPQAHLVENYCLSHKEFVSKLCILPWQPDILVAGSGETSIKTFHWQTGKLTGELSILGIISESIASSTHDLSEHKPLRKLAVSGIWPIEAEISPGHLAGKSGFVLVAFEGYDPTGVILKHLADLLHSLPLLLSLEWSSDQELVYHETVELPGNALDVVVLQGLQTILVSTDNVHIPGSVKRVRVDSDSARLGDSLVSFKLTNEDDLNGQNRAERNLRWALCGPIAPETRTLTFGSFVPEVVRQPNDKATYSVLGEFLYGLENLRKNRSVAEVAEETLHDDALHVEEVVDEMR